MELRLIIAYSLILVIVAGLTAAYLYATRDWRAWRRAVRREDRVRRLSPKERLLAENGA